MTNTKNIIIADRYADALVKLAQEGKLTFEKINSDLNSVKEILTKSTDLKEFLINPIVSIDSKKEVLDKVFANEINTLIINFLKIMVDKNRFETFDEVINSYNKYLDEINNISRIEVTSAIEMSKDSQNRLKEKLESRLKKNVVLDLNINPDIIAGLVIKIGDNVVDMSIKHKLQDLSTNIIR